MEARRRQSEDHIARPRSRAVEEVIALDDAEAGSGEVERALLHEPWVLGRLAADQRTTRLSTARGHAADEICNAVRIEPTDGDVVEERERLGAAAGDVVGAHCHEVDADRVPPPEGSCDRGFRADPVGRGHDHRLAVPGRDRDPTPEPAQAPDDLRSTGRFDRLAHELDRAIASGDVDAGPCVGNALMRATLSHEPAPAPRA